MRKYPFSVQILIGIYTAAAAALIGSAVAQRGLPQEDLPTFLALGIFAAATLLYPVKSPRGQGSFALCNIFVFAGLLLLSPAWSLLLPVVIWVPTLPKRFRSGDPYFWVPPLINASQLVVASAAAAWLIDLAGAGTMAAVADVAWLMTAAALFVAIQTLSVSILMALYRNVPWWSLDGLHLESLLSELFQPVLGVIIAALYRVSPPSLLLVGVVLAILYRMLRGIQLVRQAELDPKTGLYNYRYFEEQIQKEVTRALSLRRPVSLIFADLDFLRETNNTYGHPAGDRVIRQVASVLQSVAGHTGLPARFGGEEFVLLLPGTDIEEAAYIAERLREKVEQSRITLPDGRLVSVTISSGVASCPRDGRTPEELVQAADDALLKAKDEGRNRVVMAHRAGLAEANRDRPHDEPLVEEADPAESRDRTELSASREEAGSHPAAPIMISGLTLAGMFILAWIVTDLQQGTDWWALGFFMLAGAVAQRLQVVVYADDATPRSIAPSVMVTMAAAAYLGPAEAVAVNLAAALAQTLQMKREPWKVAANLSMAALAAAAGGLPFAWLAANHVPGQWTPMVTVIGAILFYGVNAGLVVGLISLENRRSPVSVWLQGLAWATPYYLSFAVLGGYLGYLHGIVGWVGTLTLFALQLLILGSFRYQSEQMNSAVGKIQEARNMLAAAHHLTRKSLRDFTETISAIIDARDASLYGHSRQVARYALAIATEMGVSDPEQLEELETSALLHDLGKMGIPESLLHKPGPLTPEEYEIVKGHASIGEQILLEIRSFDRAAAIVGHHHEYWDGAGYPRGKAGKDIPLGGRILAVADALDSMLTQRPYSRPKSLPDALAELDRCAGTQFDPMVVQAVLRLAQRYPADYFRNTFEIDNISRMLRGYANRSKEASKMEFSRQRA